MISSFEKMNKEVHDDIILNQRNDKFTLRQSLRVKPIPNTECVLQICVDIYL